MAVSGRVKWTALLLKPKTTTHPLTESFRFRNQKRPNEGY